MRKVERLTKYFAVPSVQFYGGLVYDGKNIDLCDDTDESEDYFLNVKQKIRNNVVFTNIVKKYKTETGRSIEEKTSMQYDIKNGEKLIYMQGQGYILPRNKMLKLEEIKDLYDIAGGVDNDSNRDVD